MAGRVFVSILVFAGFTFFFSLSCENNNELDLYGPVECDTDNITWNSRVSAILQKNCVSCHGPDLSYNGVRHDSYSTELIVVKDGRLRGVINHADGFSKMPKDRAKLPECELKILNLWLDKGAPEN